MAPAREHKLKRKHKLNLTERQDMSLLALCSKLYQNSRRGLLCISKVLPAERILSCIPAIQFAVLQGMCIDAIMCSSPSIMISSDSLHFQLNHLDKQAGS